MLATQALSSLSTWPISQQPLTEGGILVTDAVLRHVRRRPVTVRVVIPDRREVDVQCVRRTVPSSPASPAVLRQSDGRSVAAYASAASPCRSVMPCSHFRSGLDPALVERLAPAAARAWPVAALGNPGMEAVTAVPVRNAHELEVKTMAVRVLLPRLTYRPDRRRRRPPPRPVGQRQQ